MQIFFTGCQGEALPTPRKRLCNPCTTTHANILDSLNQPYNRRRQILCDEGTSPALVSQKFQMARYYWAAEVNRTKSAYVSIPFSCHGPRTSTHQKPWCFRFQFSAVHSPFHRRQKL